MKKRMIITDDVDIRSKDLSLLSYDNIYKTKDRKVINRISDSSAKLELKDSIYAILSVSNKPINGRLYDYASLRKNVINKDWLEPYNKPFLKNHDLYEDALGRIKKTWFVDHETLRVEGPDGQENLPEKVLNFFNDKSCFKEGTGSVIVEVATTESCYGRIKAGLDMTVSQSSYMSSATCNICGKPYYGGDCNHTAGETYTLEDNTQKTCYLECKDFEPVELSIVNNPANNVSILYALEDEKTNSKPKDEKNENKMTVNDTKIDKDEDEDKIEKKENDTENKKENNDSEDVMFKELYKQSLSKTLNIYGEDFKKSFEAVFDSLEKDEQYKNLQKLLDSLSEIVKTTEVEEIKDEVEQKEVEEAKEEKEETEAPLVDEKEEKQEETIKDEQEEKEPEKEVKDEEDTKAKDLEEIYKDNKENIMDESFLSQKAMILLNNL